MEIHEKATVKELTAPAQFQREKITHAPPPQKTLSFSTMVTFYGSLHLHLDFGLSEGSVQRVIIDIR